jgi:hypothetical protein
MFGWLFNLLRAGALAQSIAHAVEAALGLAAGQSVTIYVTHWWQRFAITVRRMTPEESAAFGYTVAPFSEVAWQVLRLGAGQPVTFYVMQNGVRFEITVQKA